MGMTIGIAGAGIGGLTAAALLAQAGHDVHVFDQFDRPRPVGSGLVIQPVGLNVLDRFGAGDPARRLGAPISSMLGHEARSGRVVLDVNYGASADRKGLGIHRAALFKVIHDAAMASGAHLHANHKVVGRSGQDIICETAQHGPFDLIIDAAGAGSPLSPLKGRDLPYGAVWATVPWPEDTNLPQNRLSQRYRRADKMLGILPVGEMPNTPGQKLAAIFYSLPVAAHQTWLAQDFDAWRAEAIQLWPAFEPFLGWVTSHDDFTFASYTHGSLLRPYGTGIAHIGDAAHRASPQLGQGANMALLDAAALALALDQFSLDEALRVFAGTRAWHIRAYQTMSAAFTPQYQSDSRTLPLLRDYILAPLARTWPITRILTQLVCGDLVPPMPALTPRAPNVAREK